jgi:hypothetical protein
MWRSAGQILSGSRLGRRKSTFEPTPHIASGSRTRHHAFVHGKSLPRPLETNETEVPVEVRGWIAPAPATSYLRACATGPLQLCLACTGSLDRPRRSRFDCQDFAEARASSMPTQTGACKYSPTVVRWVSPAECLTEGFNRFVTSTIAPVASGWSGCRAGLAPAGKAPPLHGARQLQTFDSPA